MNGVRGRKANHTCESFLQLFNEVGITLLACHSRNWIPTRRS